MARNPMEPRRNRDSCSQGIRRPPHAKKTGTRSHIVAAIAALLYTNSGDTLGVAQWRLDTSGKTSNGNTSVVCRVSVFLKTLADCWQAINQKVSRLTGGCTTCRTTSEDCFKQIQKLLIWTTRTHKILQRSSPPQLTGEGRDML